MHFTTPARCLLVAAMLVTATNVGASPVDAEEGSVFTSDSYRQFGRASSARGGVVAAGNRDAAQAGLSMLKAGGNAVDAAAATMFAVGVAQFEACGIGGGGFMVYRSASGAVDTIDFREWSPLNYEFTDGASIDKNRTLYAWGAGHNVVGIPGSVAGIDLALRRHGTRPLQQAPLDGRMNVLDPAIALALDGFTVPKSAADSVLANKERLAAFPATAAIYMGAPAHYTRAEKMRNLPLAEDMLELKRLGAGAFYDPDLPGGTIADDLLAEMNRPSPYYYDQAHWISEDLTKYRAEPREAVRTRYRGAEYIGMGAPSSAGTAVAEVLNILEGYDLRTAGQSSADQVHLFAEAMKLAWRDRAHYLGDPGFTPTPAHLTSKDYAATLRSQIDLARAQAFDGTPPSVEGSNTTNIAVIDGSGNAVALNCSIEQPMGSGVTAAGTGFLLNNQLTDFEHVRGGGPAPPYDNGNGPANGWAPRKRPRSSMSPTIVVRHDRPVLVTGGAGGASIIAATAAAVLNVVDYRQDVAHAIDAERADPRGNCPDDNGVQLCVETTRFDPDVLEELRRRGHAVKLSSASTWWAPCFGDGECEYGVLPLTHAAGVNSATGCREAASDPRGFADQPSTYEQTGFAAVAQGAPCP
ncbi:MAG TPA: gamma-glutamyltransferase family protein [Acidimicrobiales bacterium]|nr:gamma-glutamyltransferase family protein [Acidimicrobiales bacterium]